MHSIAHDNRKSKVPVQDREVLDHMTDAEVEFVLNIRKHLTSARISKMCGELNFKAIMRDGGILKKMTTVSVEDK